MENPIDRLAKLETELAGLKRAQETCRHEFGAVKEETRYRKEGYGHRLIPELSHGSDPYFGYEGYTDVPYTVYIRQCPKCGLKQETEKTETIVVKTVNKPVF